ncbi:MAG TPA: ethanolamine ammonia-lyase subunit EutC [Methylophilaceae bacterium]|jgi:ethanolamine ammonia-lyase small subunit
MSKDIKSSLKQDVPPQDGVQLDRVQSDPWAQLKSFTRARIALGRVGSSLPTKEVLSFGLSHAMARDAVHLALDVDALAAQIEALGLNVIKVHSRAPDRAGYLLRPDFGRRLDAASLGILQANKPQKPIDFMLVIGDGLSSLAVQRHVAPLITEIQKILPETWVLGDVVIASQARVAIADEVGEALGARLIAMLIGERPGLSSPDSLGIYLTYAPKVGYSDADRNCISNVRPEGLNYAAAAKKMMWLAVEAMRLQVSGVMLKDESDAVQIEVKASPELGI